MKITFYGHACFGVEIAGEHLLFDPFITGNELASGIDISTIPADYILLSHGHEDHVLDAEAIAKRTGAKIIATFEIVNWYLEKGVDGHSMNLGGSWQFPFGKVKFVTAIHSSVLPDGTNGGNPGGFVIESEEGNFYFAGDTALTYDMKLIPMTCAPLDFAVLPIGDNFTMGYNDAAIAADWVEANKVLACHYDTFGYIVVDKEEAKKAFAKRGQDLIFMKIGESIDKNDL
ncbi:MAG TPA: metal-dependent hydrolase [Saprospiraceae bacterium]|nr:metal-dependent hydrolase [Saprospiraceae bacterium]